MMLNAGWSKCCWKIQGQCCKDNEEKNYIAIFCKILVTITPLAEKSFIQLGMESLVIFLIKICCLGWKEVTPNYLVIWHLANSSSSPVSVQDFTIWKSWDYWGYRAVSFRFGCEKFLIKNMVLLCPMASLVILSTIWPLRVIRPKSALSK